MAPATSLALEATRLPVPPTVVNQVSDGHAIALQEQWMAAGGVVHTWVGSNIQFIQETGVGTLFRSDLVLSFCPELAIPTQLSTSTPRLSNEGGVSHYFLNATALSFYQVEGFTRQATTFGDDFGVRIASDGKRFVFTNIPNVPNAANDLWSSGGFFLHADGFG